MTIKELREKVKISVFSRNDIAKLFPNEPENQINTQISRMIKRGDLIGIKRGLYSFPNLKIDEFVLANKLSTPSYVSLESALNVYEIIPDIAVNVTSVTTITPKELNTPLGTYVYSKLAKDLFFGYKNVQDSEGGFFYQIALPEKALLDYVYIRRIRGLTESRIDMNRLNMRLLKKFGKFYPEWVRNVCGT